MSIAIGTLDGVVPAAWHALAKLIAFLGVLGYDRS
ncbi:protein of unknown function [Nitrospira japonica]|uniref:Uncharacterized protein n=1 Tax=Nitrospira japonica TaxID=1325564 RepID=A0A1W1I0L2_9BACT|nr:protein of unknown function [Nitrospira japonica]